MTPTPSGPETPDPEQSTSIPDTDVPERHAAAEAESDGPGSDGPSTEEAAPDAAEAGPSEGAFAPPEFRDDTAEDVVESEESPAPMTEPVTRSPEPDGPDDSDGPEIPREETEPVPPAAATPRRPVPDLVSFPGEFAPDPQEDIAPEFRTLMEEMLQAREEPDASAGKPDVAGTGAADEEAIAQTAPPGPELVSVATESAPESGERSQPTRPDADSSVTGEAEEIRSTATPSTDVKASADEETTEASADEEISEASATEEVSEGWGSDDSTKLGGHEDVGRAQARQRLLTAMRPRATRAQLVAFLLCGVLGFALFVSVRQTQEQGLSSLRQSDLFSLLDSVSERSAQLEDEARRLEQVEDQLRSGSDTSAAAQEAARQRIDVLGILAGTAPAQGPGIQLDIADPEQRVDAAMVLDIIEELRDAGAEAIQVDDSRVVASTAFVDEVDGVSANGQVLTIPYRILAIGDPQTLSAALDIPGGVRDTLRQVGATGVVLQKDTVVVSAVLPAQAPEYARPAQTVQP